MSNRENDDGCYEHEQPVTHCACCQWQLEKRFWASLPKLQRFDIEETAHGYDSYRDMVKSDCGDWVRAEDFRSKVEQLRKHIQSVSARVEAIQHSVDQIEYAEGYADPGVFSGQLDELLALIRSVPHAQ
jgi:hypothetical protein